MSDAASQALALLALDALALGGAVVRAPAGPARDAWLAALRSACPASSPWHKLPLNAGDERLLGGMDLAATLSLGRPVVQPGLLAQADGGVLLLAMAERVSSATAARITQMLDTGTVQVQREGFALAQPARCSVLALDEGADADERVAPALAERLAFHVALPPRWQADAAALPTAQALAQARLRLDRLPSDAGLIEALCTAAMKLGIAGLRAPWLAWRAARALAALRGATEVGAEDASQAAGLVLAHRATRLPQAEDEAPEPPETADDSPPANEPPAEQNPEQSLPDGPLEDQMLAAAIAALPTGLLAALKAGVARRRRRADAGKAGVRQQAQQRGRPLPARPGLPRGGQRLAVLDTLRAAAPWQGVRARTAMTSGAVPAGEIGPKTGDPMAGAHPRRLIIRKEDFHLRRFQHKTQTTTIFVVDASGSQALHRLSEAKGAVELLLADCYVRRDQVALLAFRGQQAELLLAPTRSLVRAKRALAGLPGGGGTPLASALLATQGLAKAVQQRGHTPVLVLLTDGRANIARDGSPGREVAMADALAAARMLAADGHHTLWLDTATQAQAAAQTLALACAAHYVPLPHADARSLARAVAVATAA
jgi:magnesium chelatase subunit D